MKTKSKVKSACILLLLCTGILTMSGCSMGMGRETLENDVLRVGMDFRIRCLKCGHEVMVPRAKIERNIKKILRDENE